MVEMAGAGETLELVAAATITYHRSPRYNFLFLFARFMQHRHLNHQRLTLAAIDDVISRGRWQDWAELRRAALQDLTLLEKVQRICKPRISDPYAQRYHFWMHYAQEHLANRQAAA